MIGITPEYTRGDKIIAYSVFGYSIIYQIGIAFLMIVIWNAVSPWPKEWWTIKFYITSLLIPGIVGIISTVWFVIGGAYDTYRLFADLEKRSENPEDNGQVFQDNH